MGGFFDEDNRKFERALAALGMVMVLYVGSFGTIRYRASDDACNMEIIDFPRGPARMFYRPLINLDKLLFRKVIYRDEPDEIARSAREANCGE